MKLTEILINNNIQALLLDLDKKAPLLAYSIKNCLDEISNDFNKKENIKKICHSIITEFLINENVSVMFDYTQEEVEEIRKYWNEDLFSFLNMVTEKNIENAKPKELSQEESITNLIDFVVTNTLFVFVENRDDLTIFELDNNIFDYADVNMLTEKIQNILPLSDVQFVDDDGMLHLRVKQLEAEKFIKFKGSSLLNMVGSILTETDEIYSGIITYVDNFEIEGVLEFGTSIAEKNVSVNILGYDGIPYMGKLIEVIKQ